MCRWSTLTVSHTLRSLCAAFVLGASTKGGWCWESWKVCMYTPDRSPPILGRGKEIRQAVSACLVPMMLYRFCIITELQVGNSPPATQALVPTGSLGVPWRWAVIYSCRRNWWWAIGSGPQWIGCWVSHKWHCIMSITIATPSSRVSSLIRPVCSVRRQLGVPSTGRGIE